MKVMCFVYRTSLINFRSDSSYKTPSIPFFRANYEEILNLRVVSGTLKVTRNISLTSRRKSFCEIGSTRKFSLKEKFLS